MKYSAKQYAEALYDSLEGTDPKDVDLVLNNFVEILALNNDVKIFSDIETEFHKLELAKQGKKLAEVTSAHPLSRENEKHIMAELNRLVKGDVELKKRIDEKVLGGVMITINDQMIDATVKNELQELKKDLSN